MSPMLYGVPHYATMPFLNSNTLYLCILATELQYNIVYIASLHSKQHPQQTYNQCQLSLFECICPYTLRRQARLYLPVAKDIYIYSVVISVPGHLTRTQKPFKVHTVIFFFIKPPDNTFTTPSLSMGKKTLSPASRYSSWCHHVDSIIQARSFKKPSPRRFQKSEQHISTSCQEAYCLPSLTTSTRSRWTLTEKVVWLFDSL